LLSFKIDVKGTPSIVFEPTGNLPIGRLNWEGRFNKCMRRNLNTIFADDGNPVWEAVFILGVPESVIALEAECAWEATFLKELEDYTALHC